MESLKNREDPLRRKASPDKQNILRYDKNVLDTGEFAKNLTNLMQRESSEVDVMMCTNVPSLQTEVFNSLAGLSDKKALDRDDFAKKVLAQICGQKRRHRS